jgi:hypothetical protein
MRSGWAYTAHPEFVMLPSLALFQKPRHAAHSPRVFALLALVAMACSPAATGSQLGSLELGLTTEAGGVAYRLSHANFTLEGPEKRAFSAEDEDQLELTLPSGGYRLTLADGFALVRKDDLLGPPVGARLVSQNPAPVLISAGQTTRTTLRFELDQGDSLALGTGVLQVGITIGTGDAGQSGDAACALGLRINEVDYEQASSDDAEFIELLNPGVCTAQLEGVLLELVNGGDGKVYSRYALGEVAKQLAPGARLVIADAKVLETLPASVPRAPLNGSGLQNGPDGLRLLRDDTIIDALAYEDVVAGSSEGKASPADEGEQALSRCPDGFDTGDGSLDVALSAPTPGVPNVCS